MYYIDGMLNELRKRGYKWKGMSKRVRLKDEEIIQIHIFPNEEGVRYSSCKNDNFLGHAGVVMAGHWNTKEPVPKEFCGSQAEQHWLASVPAGMKEG